MFNIHCKLLYYYQYGRQRRVIGSWKMYKDWCRCCCFSCCCGRRCCGCCLLNHFPNYLVHFSKLSREAAVFALWRWRRRPMPDPSKRSRRQIRCADTTFGHRRSAAAPNPLCLSAGSHNFANERFRVRPAAPNPLYCHNFWTSARRRRAKSLVLVSRFA